MAINQQQFGQRYEKLIAQGVPDEEAMRQAEEFATIKPQQAGRRRNPLAKAIVKKRKGGSWLRELLYGSKTYLNETPEERKTRVALEKE